MIKTLETVLVVKDTTLVRREGHASMHGNRERLLHQSSLHLLRVALSHFCVRGNIDSCLAHLVVLARVVYARQARLIRIGRLELGHMTLVVLEGAHLNSSITASITIKSSRAAD